MDIFSKLSKNRDIMNTNFYLNNLHNDSVPRSMKAFKSDPRNSQHDLESILDSKRAHRINIERTSEHNESEYQFMNQEEKAEEARNEEFVSEATAPEKAIKASTFEDFVLRSDGLGREITKIQKQILADAFAIAANVVLTTAERNLTTDKIRFAQKVVCIAMSTNNLIEEYITSFRSDKSAKQLLFIRNCILDSAATNTKPRIIFNLISCHVYMVNSVPSQHYIKTHRLSEIAAQNTTMPLNLKTAQQMSNKQLKKLSYQNRDFRHNRVFGHVDIKSMVASRDNPPEVNTVIDMGLGPGKVTTRLHKMIKLPEDEKQIPGAMGVQNTFLKVKPTSYHMTSKKTIPLSKEQRIEMKRNKRLNNPMLELSPKEIADEKAFQEQAAKKKAERDKFNEGKKAEIAAWREGLRQQAASNGNQPDKTINPGSYCQGNGVSATVDSDGPAALEIRAAHTTTPVLVMVDENFSFHPTKLRKSLKKILLYDFDIVRIELISGSMFPLVSGSYIVISIVKNIRCNTLNGNNGSVTNTDDVKKSAHAALMNLRADNKSKRDSGGPDPKWMRNQIPGLERIEPTAESLTKDKVNRKAQADFYGCGGWEDRDFGKELKAALTGGDTSMAPVLKYQDEYHGQSQDDKCRIIKNLSPTFIAKSSHNKTHESFHMIRKTREKKVGWQIRKMYSEMKKKGKERKGAVFEFCTCGSECDKDKFCRAWTSDITQPKPRLYIAACQRPHSCNTSCAFISAGIESVCDNYCDLCECEPPVDLAPRGGYAALDVTHMYTLNEEEEHEPIKIITDVAPIAVSPVPLVKDLAHCKLPVLKRFQDGSNERAYGAWEKESETEYAAAHKRQVSMIMDTDNADLLDHIIRRTKDQISLSTHNTPPQLVEYLAQQLKLAESRLASMALNKMAASFDTQVKTAKVDPPVMRAMTVEERRDVAVIRDASTPQRVVHVPPVAAQAPVILPAIPDDGWADSDSDDESEDDEADSLLPAFIPSAPSITQIFPAIIPPLRIIINPAPVDPAPAPLPVCPVIGASFTQIFPAVPPPMSAIAPSSASTLRAASLPLTTAVTPVVPQPRGNPTDWMDATDDGISDNDAQQNQAPSAPLASEDEDENDDMEDTIPSVLVPSVEPEFELCELIAVSSLEHGSWCATLNTSTLKLPGTVVNLYQYDKASNRVRSFVPGENEEYATGPLSHFVPVMDGTPGLTKSKTQCGLYVLDYEDTQSGCLANALIRYVEMTVEADDITWFKTIRTLDHQIDQFFTKNAGKRLGYLRTKKKMTMPVFIPFVTLVCSKNSPLLVSTLSSQNVLCELKRFIAIAHGYMPMDIMVGTFLYIMKKNYNGHMNAHAVTNSLIEVNDINVGHRASYLDRRLAEVIDVKQELQSAPDVFFTPYAGVSLLDGVAMFKLNSDESYFLDSFGKVKPEFHHLTIDSVRFDMVKKKGNVISYDPLKSQIIFNTALNAIVSRVPRLAISHNFLTFGNCANAQNHLEPTVQSAAMLRLLQPRSNEMELFSAQRRTAIEIIYTMAKLMDSGVIMFDESRSDDLWRQFASYADHNEINLPRFHETPHGSIAVLRESFCSVAYQKHWIFTAEWKDISAGVLANAIINICQRKSEAFDSVENLLNILETDRERALEEAIRYVGGPKMKKRLEMFEKLKRNPLTLHTIEKMAVAQIKPFEFQKMKSKGFEQYLQYARIVANLTETFYFYQNPPAHRIHKKTLSTIYEFNIEGVLHPTIRVVFHDYESKQSLEEVFMFTDNDPELSRFTPFVAGSPLSGGTSQYYGVYYSYIMLLHQKQLASHTTGKTPQWIITYSDDSITYKAGKVNESDITKNDLSHTIYSFSVCFASNCERLAAQLLTSYEAMSWPIKVQAIESYKDYVLLLARFLAFLFSGGMLTTGSNNKQDMVCLILTVQGGSSADYGFEMTENIMDAHKASFLSHVFTKLEYPMSAKAINQAYISECQKTGKAVSNNELYPEDLQEVYIAYKLPATIFRKFGRRDMAYTRNQTPHEEIYKDILGAAAHSSALYVKALRIGYVTNVLLRANVRGKNSHTRRLYIGKELIAYTKARVAWSICRPSLTNEDFAILRAHMTDTDDFNEILEVYYDFCDSLISKMRPSGFINHRMVDIFNKKRYDMRASCWSDDTCMVEADVVDPNLDLLACQQ